MNTEQQLQAMLHAAGVTRKSIYRPGEVCAILGISLTTLATLCDSDQHSAAAVQHPKRLTCYRLTSHRRIPHQALVEWLERNIAYERDK